MSDGTVSRTRAWVMAARPHTLPAGAAPVFVGTGLAVHDGGWAPFPAFAALVGALCLQIGTNFANDYYDARHGADSADSEGFVRVTEAGLVPPPQVRLGMGVAFAAAITIGTYLVYVGGLPILVVGLLSVAAGILYTGGPYPYGYRGLGDLFVFVFFGLVGVTGTYYVQAVASRSVEPFPLWIPAGTVPLSAIAASLPVAGLVTAVLVVNNIRDRETDAAADKRTLAVYLGYRWSRVEYLALLALAYLVPLGFLVAGYHPAVLAPLVTLPVAGSLARTVLTRTDGEALNPALEINGQLAAGHAALFAMGLAVPGLL